MAEVHVISVCTVRLATTTTSTDHRIELTPWDLRFLLSGPIQKGLLFFKPTGKELETETLIDRLKESLSRTLDFFPPLAGRLATSKTEGNSAASFFIVCNNTGAEFTYAAAKDLTVADIIQPVYLPSVVHSFFPLNGVRNHEGVSNPLLSVQFTELIDGFFIGCSINHSVADGTSFWHFFNSWSEISRGNHISTPPTFHHRFPDDDANFPIQIPDFYEKILVERSIPPPIQERVFHFSKENIGKLKARANGEMATDRISSLQSLMAHVWRSAIRCRHHFITTNDQQTSFRLVFGTRQRSSPPLPNGYFGNAIYGKAVTATVGELLENGTGWAAWRMNQMVALQTQEEVRKLYNSCAKKPVLVELSGMNRMMNRYYFLMASSPRFNVYGNDFGWGKPVAVRSGAENKLDGMVTVFQGVEEGSIDIEVCLPHKTLQAMGDDPEFMEVVTLSF